VRAGSQEKLAKGREKMIVPGLAPRIEMPHGKCVDELRVKFGIGIGRSRRRLATTGIARRREQRAGGAVNAQAVGDGEFDVGLRVDCPRQVVVKVASLGHLLEK